MTTTPSPGDTVSNTGVTSRNGATGRRRIDGIVDLGGVFASLLIVGLALGPAFGGPQPLLLTAWGGLVGVGVLAVANRTGRNAFVTVVALLIGFAVASGPAVAHAAPFGFVPAPGALLALLKGLVHAWSDVTTTAPPTGVADGFGVIPYVGGFLAATIAHLLAVRTRIAALPVVPMYVLLVVNVLLGVREPQSVLLQGGVLTVLALGWSAHRENRKHRLGDSGFHLPRFLSASGMLVFVLIVGLFAGPMVFDTGLDHRYVIRDHVDPPLDPRDLPSPLNGFRNYIADAYKDTEFFEIEGLPKDARIRLATMDTFDGVVWAVGGPRAPGSGYFDRVGTSILPTPPGEKVDLRITVEKYTGNWVPTVGATRVNRFTGRRATELNGAFRFNQTTGDGASLVPLVRGDTIEVEARVASDRREAAENKSVDGGAMAALPQLPEMPDELRAVAGSLISGAVTDYDKAAQLEQNFQKGYYSDGGPGVEAYKRSASGHSIYRMRSFLDQTRSPVGNAEQYAAAMALVARMSGLPARVVMGFDVPEEDRAAVTKVLGTHVHAWVEIAFQDVGWIAFDPTPDRDREPEQVDKRPPELVKNEIPPEPVHQYVRPPDLNVEQDTDEGSEEDEAAIEGALIPGWLLAIGRYIGMPLLVVAAVLGSIIGFKGLRRRRWRSRGTPTDRVLGAWRDGIANVRDLGVPVTLGARTRNETVSEIPAEAWPHAEAFVGVVDAALFGPAVPDDQTADSLWQLADEQRDELVGALPLVRRLRVAVSLRSILSSDRVVGSG